MKSTVTMCVLLALVVGAARGADEPAITTKWGGASDPNQIANAGNLPADLEKAAILWELPIGSHQYTVPTIDRGRLYVGANDAALERPGVKRTGGGVLRCLDQASGTMIWQLVSPRYMKGTVPPYHFNQWKCGFCSQPVIDGDRLYIVGGRGEILCLDRHGQANGNDGPFTDELAYMGVKGGGPGTGLGPKDGDIIWRYNLLTELNVVPHDVCGSTLLLHGDLLYACSSNGLDDRHDKIPAPEAPALIVLNKKTGKLVAQEGEKISSRLLHGHWSSPSLGRVNGKTLIFFGGGDGVLYAFAPPKPGPTVKTLELVWSYDCNPAGYRMRNGNPVPYSKWNRKSGEGPSEVIGTPVFYNGRVYATIGQSPVHGVGKGNLACIDAATGKKVWESRLVDRSLSTVSIADGLLYILDHTGSVHCFDADTGKRHWMFEMGQTTWCCSTLVADGKVYFCSERGRFFVLEAGKELKLLSKTRLRSPAITVAVTDGVLYLPTQKRLIAYTTKKTAPSE